MTCPVPDPKLKRHADGPLITAWCVAPSRHAARWACVARPMLVPQISPQSELLIIACGQVKCVVAVDCGRTLTNSPTTSTVFLRNISVTRHVTCHELFVPPFRNPTVGVNSVHSRYRRSHACYIEI